MIRTASAQWLGSGKEGKGTLTTQTEVLKNTPYSFHSRFAEGNGTNPEELIAAAHAGCYSMKLSFILVEKGFTPEYIDTAAKLTFEDGTIKSIHLETKVKVSGMNNEQFMAAAEEAKVNCPVSKALNAAITLSAQLA
jgi:osmotically inducible protein OsmC